MGTARDVIQWWHQVSGGVNMPCLVHNTRFLWPFYQLGESMVQFRVPTHSWKPGKWKINFQAWKCPGKKKKMKMSWKSPGNSLKIHTKLELSIFLEDLYAPKTFSHHKLLSWKISVLTLKSPGKVVEKWIWRNVGSFQSSRWNTVTYHGWWNFVKLWCKFWISTHKFVEFSHYFSWRKALVENSSCKYGISRTETVIIMVIRCEIYIP